MTEEAQNNDDNFAAAFDKLAELGDVDAPAKKPEAEPVAAPTGDAAVPSAVEPAAAATDDLAAVPVAGDALAPLAEETKTEPDTTQASDDELLARFADIVKKHETAPVAPSAPADKPEPFTEAEKAFLADYEKDWPDVARAEALRRRAEYGEVVGYVFQEVAKELAPLLGAVRALSERTHLADLQTVVTDYDDVRDKVVEWVGKQPKYLQPAYNHVVQQGTVDEVADLIERYRRDTGAQLTPAAAPPASKPVVELPAATKKAAAALAPVASKRSAVVQTTDASDFDGAFEAFARKP